MPTIYVDYFLNIPRSDAVKHPSDLAHEASSDTKVKRGQKK